MTEPDALFGLVRTGVAFFRAQWPPCKGPMGAHNDFLLAVGSTKP